MDDNKKSIIKKRINKTGENLKKNNMEFKPSYFIMTIRKFAEHYSMTSKQAYQYLKRFAGIAFLDDCFEAEHTLSFEDAIEDLTRVCQNHGGYLKYA